MSETIVCPICNNYSHFLLEKSGTAYFECSNCKTIVSNNHELNNETMIGGEFEPERNEKENGDRIDRVSKLLGGYKKDARVLDFGCGHGLFLEDLKKAGFNADGYDLYNKDYNEHLPKRDRYNLVTAVEVFEHFSSPYYEIDVIYRCLQPGGAVCIETGFVDVPKEDGIPIYDYFYINPDAGHSTIFSHHGLDVLMVTKGFTPMHHYNRHWRIYQKK